MFIDYTQLVLEDYERKKKENTLSTALQRPSAAKLRDECYAVCEKRYNPKTDKQILNDFFGKEEKSELLKAIKNIDPDKLKPLVNLMNRKTNPGKTSEINVELLAWLIAFQLRPFEYGRAYIMTEGDEREKNVPNDATERIPDAQEEKTAITNGMKYGEGSPVAPANKPSNLPPGNKRLVAKLITPAVLLLFLAGIMFYRKTENTTPESGSCMYWSGEHYEPISCKEKAGKAMVIALDAVRLNEFKKITRPDTLSIKDIEYTWYTKMHGVIEFYTADGFHPIDVKRKLKPVTQYIIEKYIAGQ